MRIISKFKDYYDSAQAYGADGSETWVRNSTDHFKEITRDKSFKTIKEEIAPSIPDFQAVERILLKHGYEQGGFRERQYECKIDGKKMNLGIDPIVVLFCGAVYYGIRFFTSCYHPLTPPPVISEVIWSRDQLAKFAAIFEVCVPNWDKLSPWAKSHFHFLGESIKAYPNLKGLDSLYACIRTVDLTDWSIRNRVTLMAVGDHGKAWEKGQPLITTNPQLSKYEFYRVFDAFSAYQEIRMFRSNLANPEPEMIEIEDRYKQIEHGHDHKYSFKKEPTKRKE